MQWRSCSKTLAVFAMFTVALVLAPNAWAGVKYTVLYKFKGARMGGSERCAGLGRNGKPLWCDRNGRGGRKRRVRHGVRVESRQKRLVSEGPLSFSGQR
jgi:hypothetical protein